MNLLSAAVSPSNQITLSFSGAIKIVPGASLSSKLLIVKVNGQSRTISSVQVSPSSASKLLVTLTGAPIDSRSSVSVAYSAPGSGVTTGYLTDSAGTKLNSIASQVVNTYTTNASKTVLGSAYLNLLLTESAEFGSGNAQDNTITGNGNKNTLDGLGGNDTLIGMGGDDTYVVDAAGDVVVELANEGTDTVEVESISKYFLGANVENLTLKSCSFNGTGNELNNILTGNWSKNRLDGRAGSDTMIGGGGDDTYVVDSDGDTILETDSLGGLDLVEASVNWTLGNNLEKLTLTGTNAISGTGNNLENTIVGNWGNNKLSGGSDNVTDVLTGRGGADTFCFSSKPLKSKKDDDRITDFSSSEGDKIQIDKAAFGITASSVQLRVVNGSVKSLPATSNLFVYQAFNGWLCWYPEGMAKGTGIGDVGGVLAILDNKPSLTAGDIVLV